MTAIYARHAGPRRRVHRQIQPSSRPAFPVGAILTNRFDEVDRDLKGDKRVTKAGNRWSVFYVDGDIRHICCEETGGWLSPTVKELRALFVAEKEWP